MKRHVLLITFCSIGNAQKKDMPAEPLPTLAFVPPIVRSHSVAQDEDQQNNAFQVMTQVVPRIAIDAKKRKWPVAVLPPNTISDVFQAVTGRDVSTPVRFGDLKPLAEKAGCRYLVVFSVNELSARYFTGIFDSRRLRARANIDLSVYDHDTNEYIWKMNRIAETDHPYNMGPNVGLRREQDGALNKALTEALEPFAKGERKKVEREALNILVTVQRVIADGKKVVLDAGKNQNVEVGMTFKSIESDAIVRVVDVLDNGSVAEVVSGAPKEKETFKVKAD